MKKAMAARPRRTGLRGENIKRAIRNVGLLLLILAAANLYVGIKGISAIRPADRYEDGGVHTFAPYNILPVQVRNNGRGRYQRMNPTRTVYMVYYRATDGSGYQWRTEGGSARVLAEQVYDRGPVERRVLFIPADDTYITVEADQTAESYTAGLRQRYILILGLSGGYVVVYLVARVVMRNRRKTRKEVLW